MRKEEEVHLAERCDTDPLVLHGGCNSHQCDCNSTAWPRPVRINSPMTHEDNSHVPIIGRDQRYEFAMTSNKYHEDEPRENHGEIEDGSSIRLPTMKKEMESACFWRDVVAEFIATLVLVSAQAALPLTWGSDFGGPIHVAIGMGFVVTAMAWAMGDFGGAHMNPSVTIGMALCRKVTILKAAVFVLIQCAGAIAGAGLIYVATPANRRENLAATSLSEELHPWQGVLIEAWITFILVLTIHGSTNQLRKTDGIFMPPIPIGMAVSLGILSAFKQTGGSMNPARSLGPAIIMGIWKHHWIYWMGPILGSVAATVLYSYFLDRVGRNKLAKV